MDQPTAASTDTTPPGESGGVSAGRAPAGRTGAPRRFSPPVHAALAEHEALKARIIAECGDEEDEETLRDTLEGATRLDEILAGLITARDDDLALGESLRAHIRRCRARLQRLEARADTRRRLARDIMLEASLQRIDLPDCTLTLRRVEGAVEIEDEEAIPAPFWRCPPPALDRAALQRALRRGEEIEGARLTAPSLTLVILTG